MTWWPVLVFGWGPVVAAALVFSLAFLLNRPWLAIVAAIIAMPFLLVIGGYPHPIGRLGGPIAVLANFASAAALIKGHHRLSTVLLCPFAAVAVVLAYLVVNQ